MVASEIKEIAEETNLYKQFSLDVGLRTHPKPKIKKPRRVRDTVPFLSFNNAVLEEIEGYKS